MFIYYVDIYYVNIHNQHHIVYIYVYTVPPSSYIGYTKHNLVPPQKHHWLGLGTAATSEATRRCTPGLCYQATSGGTL